MRKSSDLDRFQQASIAYGYAVMRDNEAATVIRSTDRELVYGVEMLFSDREVVDTWNSSGLCNVTGGDGRQRNPQETTV